MSRVIRRIAVVTAVVAAALVGGAASPAHAAPASGVEFRVDGGAWSSAPPSALIVDPWTPIPGASRTVTLEIRSQRSQPMVTAVYASRGRMDTELAAATTLSTPDASVALRNNVECAPLTRQIVLAPGEGISVPITISVASALAGARGSNLSFALAVEFVDVGASSLSSGCPVDAHLIPGQLADTGSAPPHGALLAGGALVTAGGALLALTLVRRRGLRHTAPTATPAS